MTQPIVNNVSWRIGGQQGEGIDSTGDIFAKAVARYGLHLYTFRSFSSRIRGGLTFFEVRVSEKPVGARPESVDVVLALVTGYFLKNADEPVPPTSPHLRDAQRWQGDVCWQWLRERRGWR